MGGGKRFEAEGDEAGMDQVCPLLPLGHMLELGSWIFFSSSK